MKDKKFTAKLFGFVFYFSDFRLIDLALFHYLPNNDSFTIIEIQICKLRCSLYVYKNIFKKFIKILNNKILGK